MQPAALAADPPETIRAECIRVKALAEDTVDAMHDLMQRYYDNAPRERFLADLRAKQWAILLHAGGALCGFSTQVAFRHSAEGRTVRVLFSGDTVIDAPYRRSAALPVAMGRLLHELWSADPRRPLYWLLTSKGYKTYRYLPLFFLDHYPAPGRAVPPFESALLRELGRRRFGARFDAEAGVVRAEGDAQRLRPGVADITPGRRGDPYVAFFEARNPGHARGDELVCLARYAPDRVTPFIRRRIGA